MASITSPTRPDSNYYVNIQQQSDLTWTADEMSLDDILVGRPFMGYSQTGHSTPGLRTRTALNVTAQAQQLINVYAPPDVQRNCLAILSTSTTGTAHDNAKAAMDWVAAVNAYRDSQVANVHTLNFAQLVAYVVPVGVPPWPAPPSTLPPASPSTSSFRAPTSRIK